MSAAIALLIGLAVGFACAMLLTAWAQHIPAPPPPPAPSPPASIAQRFEPVADVLARRAFFGGVRATCGAMPPPTALALHFEIGAAQIARSRAEIAKATAHAYAEGVREIRDALGIRTGIDNRALDEAVAIALEDVAA